MIIADWPTAFIYKLYNTKTNMSIIFALFVALSKIKVTSILMRRFNAKTWKESSLFLTPKQGRGHLKICGGVNKELGFSKPGLRCARKDCTRERSVKSENAMDIGQNIGVESWKIIGKGTPRKSKTLSLSAAHWAIIFFCPMRSSPWGFPQASCQSTPTWCSARTGKPTSAGPASDA